MLNWNQENTNATGGFEIELAHPDHDSRSTRDALLRRLRYAFEAAGLTHFGVVSDGSENVTAEIVTPPLPIRSDRTYRIISEALTIAKQEGFRYQMNCGLHVHIGVRRLKAGIDLNHYTDEALRKARQSWGDANGSDANMRYPDADLWFTPASEGMQFELIKDVCYRYGKDHDRIDAAMPRSRVQPSSGFWTSPRCPHTGRRYDYAMLRTIAQNATDERFLNADTNSEIGRAGYVERLAGLLARDEVSYRQRYRTINLTSYPNGTIEFRQHPTTLSSKKIRLWAEFILNIIEYSDAKRIRYAEQLQTETVYSPDCPFRYSSNIGQLYQMARRTEGGATVQEMQMQTGMSADNIRARFTEIRQRIGHDLVVTHTQQAYNHRYGTSRGLYNLGGYEILDSVQRTVTGAASASIDHSVPEGVFNGQPYSIVRWIGEGRVTDIIG